MKKEGRDRGNTNNANLDPNPNPKEETKFKTTQNVCKYLEVKLTEQVNMFVYDITCGSSRHALLIFT